jgi:microcystin-dependent protein
MSKSVDVEVANIKEAMTGLNNEKVITPYSLNQVIKRKAGSGSGSSTPGVGLNYYWNGTELGVKREDEENYIFVDLQGPAGTDGQDGTPGTNGTNGTNGTDGTNGTNGVDGIDGDDGREVELQVTATHIQWRYVGDISWTNLIALSLLKGADGADGVDGTNGTNGVDGQDGAPGQDGADGKQVLLQKSATHIQWKYDTDVTWTNLVALVDLKGADGITPHIDPTTKNWFIGTTDTGILAEGTNGADGTNGVDGHTPIKGVDYFDGQDGAPGQDGADGADGSPGPGIAAGGSTNNLLVKKSAVDYDTAWMTLQTLFSLIYPVGAIYMSVVSTNPSTLFGGTWVAWGSGRVPVGIDTSQTEFDTVEETGGEKTHTLSVNEMPTHTHGSKTITGWFEMRKSTGDANEIAAVDGTVFDSASTSNSSTTITNSSTKHDRQRIKFSATHEHSSVGGDEAHNNLQPYITCYMWKRTA